MKEKICEKKYSEYNEYRKGMTDILFNLYKHFIMVTKKQTNELISKHKQMVDFLKNVVTKIENDLKRIKIILDQLVNFNPKDPESLKISDHLNKTMGTEKMDTYTEDDIQVVEGNFDGDSMVGPDQKKYPVHPNYSSKTKLVAGDILKLRILPDGKFIYKLIQPVERKHVKATLSKNNEGKYIAVSEYEGIYFLNQAAVTFFKGKPGDKLYILINKKEEQNCAAIEAIIKN